MNSSRLMQILTLTVFVIDDDAEIRKRIKMAA